MPHFVFTLLLSVLPSVTGLSCNVYTRSTSDPKAVSSVETCGADLTSCVTFQVHRRSHAACSAAALPKRSHLTLHTHTASHTPCAPLLAAVSLSRRHNDQRALRHRPRQHASDRKSMPSTEEHNRDDSRCRRHHEQLVMHGVRRCQPVQRD